MENEVHYARLMDRFAMDGEYFIVGQDARTGGCFNIRIKPDDIEHAGRLWGNASVPYVLDDEGQAVYHPLKEDAS